jgi:hypothetical protein
MVHIIMGIIIGIIMGIWGIMPGMFIIGFIMGIWPPIIGFIIGMPPIMFIIGFIMGIWGIGMFIMGMFIIGIAGIFWSPSAVAGETRRATIRWRLGMPAPGCQQRIFPRSLRFAPRW